MKLRRIWHGYLDQYPSPPDITLARLTDWSRGYKTEEATAAYPEPINLIAASAWHKIPPDHDYQHAIIFRDTATKLWVRAIGTRDLKQDQLEHWMLEQFSLGACAVWTNNEARLPRRQPTRAELDCGTRSDPVTLTHRLIDMNKYTVCDVNLIELYPELFTADDLRLPVRNNENKIKVSRGPKLPGQGSGNARCVFTPLGIFVSISAAARAHDLAQSRLYALVSSKKSGYGYLTKEEYLRRSELNIHDSATIAVSTSVTE